MKLFNNEIYTIYIYIMRNYIQTEHRKQARTVDFYQGGGGQEF